MVVMEGIPETSVQQRHARAESLAAMLVGLTWPACVACYAMAIGTLLMELRGVPAGRWHWWGLGALGAHGFAMLVGRLTRGHL